MNQSKGGEKILLSLRIANEIETLIASGEFKGQSKLPSQEELCARFSVSSSVVREAIHLLKARDILYTVNGVGSFIAERSVDPLRRLLLHYASGAQDAHDYSELMELRLAIETTCAEKLALHNTQESLKSLQASLRIMESSGKRFQAFSDADLAFHSALVDYSGNSLIKAIHASLRPTIRRFMNLTCATQQDVKRNCQEHCRIYEAIVAGNAEEASQGVRDHLSFARKNYELMVRPQRGGAAKKSRR